MKESFWNELNGSTAKVQAEKGNRILVGDFNARLGPITGDHATNSNKKYLMAFVQDHSLINMIIIKTYGEYTFHNISTGDRSIIDYVLTDMEPFRITEHKVLPGSLGTSAQTAHKALLTTIRQSIKKIPVDKVRCNPRWRTISNNNKERFLVSLEEEVSKLSMKTNYQNLLSSIYRAKTNSLRRVRPKPRTAINPSSEIDCLDSALGLALSEYQMEPTIANLRHTTLLEKRVREARSNYKRIKLLKFLDKLESLHQVDKMRTFYSEIKKKTTPTSDPS